MTEKSEEKSEQKQPGLIRRAGGGLGRYVVKRTATGPAVRSTFRHMRENLKSILHLETVDRKEVSRTYNGRYEDGGVAEFEKHATANGLDDAGLDMIARSQRTYSMIFLLGAAIFFIMSSYYVLNGHVGWGFSTFPVSLVMAALWFRHAFMAWQVRMRRFGSLSEFLKT